MMQVHKGDGRINQSINIIVFPVLDILEISIYEKIFFDTEILCDYDCFSFNS